MLENAFYMTNILESHAWSDKLTIYADKTFHND